MLARRHGKDWYIAGVNAEKEVKKVKLKLAMLAGKKLSIYNDDNKKETYIKEVSIGKTGELEIEIQPGGGFVLR